MPWKDPVVVVNEGLWSMLSAVVKTCPRRLAGHTVPFSS